MPLHVFRSRTVSAANLIQTLMVAGLLGIFFLGSLYLERVLGFGAIQIGLAFLPVALATGTLSLQQVGGALGLAVLATLSTTRSNSLLAGGVPAAYALTDGYQIAFATGAVLVIAAIVLTLTLLRTRERRAGGRLRRRGTGRVPLTALQCRSSIGAALGLRGHPPRGRLRPQPH